MVGLLERVFREDLPGLAWRYLAKGGAFDWHAFQNSGSKKTRLVIPPGARALLCNVMIAMLEFQLSGGYESEL